MVLLLKISSLFLPKEKNKGKRKNFRDICINDFIFYLLYGIVVFLAFLFLTESQKDFFLDTILKRKNFRIF